MLQLGLHLGGVEIQGIVALRKNVRYVRLHLRDLQACNQRDVHGMESVRVVERFSSDVLLHDGGEGPLHILHGELQSFHQRTKATPTEMYEYIYV